MESARIRQTVQIGTPINTKRKDPSSLRESWSPKFIRGSADSCFANAACPSFSPAFSLPAFSLLPFSSLWPWAWPSLFSWEPSSQASWPPVSEPPASQRERAPSPALLRRSSALPLRSPPLPPRIPPLLPVPPALSRLPTYPSPSPFHPP